MVLTAVLMVQSVSGKEAVARPNFIMVLIDDMGWGDLSCFGNRAARTPEVDRLAREGMKFESFYVNAPICSPTRCALLTGQHPQRWRITSYLAHRAENDRRGMAQWLDPAAPMLPRFLQGRGYATGHFGKWHLGGQRDVAEAPAITAYGFEQSLTNFEGLGPKLLPLTMRPGEAEPGRIWAEAERLGGPVTWMQRSEITGGYVDAAIGFIEGAAAQGRPFYVNVWPDDVHSPFWPPVEAWGDGSQRRLFLSVLEAMDRQLGRLFEHVRERPELRDNTLILLCSDNGPEPGAGDAGPFRGSKATLFEGGLRSPLVVWGPGLLVPEAAGTTNSRSVFSTMDLAPSLLALAGVKTPAEVEFDGEDLGGVLLGKESASRRGPLLWRRPPDRKSLRGTGPLPDLAVRDGEWKLLCDYDGGRPQLHHLPTDPGERENLAASKPEITGRLTAMVTRWHAALPPDKGPALQPSAFRKRRR